MPPARLEEALQNNRIEKSLRELTPENPQYQALRKVLGEYRAQAAKSGWPVVPATAKLKPGQKSPVVAMIARRLAASGDYTGAAVTGDAAVLGRAPGSGQALSAPSWSDRRRGRVGGDDRGDERAARAAHQPDRAQSRALALAPAGPRRAAHPRQHPRIPPGSLGPQPGPPHHARRRRQEGHADADLRRRDDLPRVQPVLERAARHRAGRDAAGSAEGPRLPRAQQHGSRGYRPAPRSIRRRSISPIRANTGSDSGPARTTRSGS